MICQSTSCGRVDASMHRTRYGQSGSKGMRLTFDASIGGDGGQSGPMNWVPPRIDSHGMVRTQGCHAQAPVHMPSSSNDRGLGRVFLAWLRHLCTRPSLKIRLGVAPLAFDGRGFGRFDVTWKSNHGCAPTDYGKASFPSVYRNMALTGPL